MQRVVHVSLHGNAYVLEEEGYAALQSYLEEAGRRLAADPDRAEILGDLEQAIAEKCARHLGPHKTVVTSAEMARVLAEMGPVAGDGPKPAGTAGQQDGAAPPPPTGTPKEATQEAPRRLYRILEGGVIGGLCAGLGAYLNVDANVVRAAFVILALVTHGAWVLVYLILLFVIPSAGTAEERAAAHGLPFSAQELVDQAKRQCARLERELRGPYARMRAKWRYEGREAWRTTPAAPPPPGAPPPSGAPPPPVTYAEQLATGVVVPILALLSAGLTVAWIVAGAMLIEKGAILGWSPGLPLWGALLALFVAVLIVGGPIRHARHALHRDAWGRGALLAAWDGLLWLGFLVLFAWAAWHLSPELRGLVHDLPGAVDRVRGSLPVRG